MVCRESRPFDSRESWPRALVDIAVWKPESAMLDHPSLVVRLPDGTFAVNDEFRARVVIIDPTLDRILWQFGRTDRPGPADGSLNTPDGIDVVPAGVFPFPTEMADGPQRVRTGQRSPLEAHRPDPDLT